MISKKIFDETARYVSIFAIGIIGLVTIIGSGAPNQTYVRKSNLERYAAQVEEAERRGSPIIINKVYTSKPNSAGGVDVEVDFFSVSNKTIKYVNIEAVPYNAVKDIQYSRIGRKTSAILEATGPYYRGSGNTGMYWENVWYNHTIVCAAVKSVEVIFMDGATTIYQGRNLGDVFASGYLNHCGDNHVNNALNENSGVHPLTSNDNSNQESSAAAQSIGNVTPSFSGLPSNAGGVSISLPTGAVNGNVVPITVNVETPVGVGDKLIIMGDDEKALELVTYAPPIESVSTRLRLANGKVFAYVVRSNGRTDSSTANIDVGTPATSPPVSSKGSTEHKVRSKGNEVKMLISNDMGQTGFVKSINLTTSGGGIISVQISPRLSKNPYLGLKSTVGLHPVTVDLGL